LDLHIHTITFTKCKQKFPPINENTGSPLTSWLIWAKMVMFQWQQTLPTFCMSSVYWYLFYRITWLNVIECCKWECSVSSNLNVITLGSNFNPVLITRNEWNCPKLNQLQDNKASIFLTIIIPQVCIGC